MNLFKIIKQNAFKYPKKIALVIESKEYTYEVFYKLILQTINNLEKNKFDKNSKVLIVEDNTLAHILALFSLSYINAVAIPTGTYYSKNHLSDIIKITNANGIIGNKEHCNFFKKKSKIKNFLCTEKSNKFGFFFKINNSKIYPKKKIDEHKNYIITMSSGSTSKPKPIIFSQNTKIIRYKLFRDLYKIKNQDNFIVTSPIDHSLGMRTLFVPLLEGCTCVIMRKFLVPKYCELIKKYKISFSVLVATQNI